MQASDRAAIKLKIAQYTKAKTATRTEARSALIGAGFFTKEGKLAAKYGGADLPEETARIPKR